MGFTAAAIGAIGSLAAAGVSAAGQSGLFGGGGPNLGEYSSTLNKNANAYLLPFSQNQGYWNIDPTSMANQSIQFGLANAPAINQQNMQQLQAMLNQAIPGYQGIVNQMAGNTQSLLAGQVPPDVAQQIQRNAAFTALQTGAGGGAGTGLVGAAAGNTARQLGLTSLDLTSRGFTQGQNLLSLGASALTPQMVNPLSLLPLSDLINASEWSKSAYFQANEATYNAKAASAAARVGATAPNVGAGLGGTLQSLTGQLGQKNPSTGQTGWGTLLGLFGGGGGGGNASLASSAFSGGGAPEGFSFVSGM